MLLLIIALVAMAVSDFADATSAIAENRDKHRLAGLLTAADNTLVLLVGVIGADTFITKGVAQAIVMGVLAFLVTFISTDQEWPGRLSASFCRATTAGSPMSL